MRQDGRDGVADILLLAFDCYLRIGEVFMLKHGDLFVAKNPAGKIEAMIRLGVAERGESTKTGMRQGVRIDYPVTIEMMQRRSANLKPGQRFFSKSSPQKNRTFWAAAAAALKVEVGPVHSIRHSGPSHDATTGYRSMWQIQRRGRWSSERSVLRYAKSHAWLQARARVPEAILLKGAQLLATLAPRPEQARE